LRKRGCDQKNNHVKWPHKEETAWLKKTIRTVGGPDKDFHLELTRDRVLTGEANGANGRIVSH